jgi:hypothetical protein
MDGVNVQTPIEDVGGETTVNLDWGHVFTGQETRGGWRIMLAANSSLGMCAILIKGLKKKFFFLYQTEGLKKQEIKTKFYN